MADGEHRKQCSKCGLERATGDFYIHKHRGITTRCKVCVIIAAKSNYWAKRGSIAAERRERYKNNPGPHKERERKRWRNSRVLRLAQNKVWRESNREHVRHYASQYQKENRDKTCAWANARRARQSGADGRYTDDDIARLYQIQGAQCACCRKSLEDGYQVDHIMPLALGGTNWPRNLQLLCADCNRSKSARHPIDFMQSMGYLI